MSDVIFIPANQLTAPARPTRYTPEAAEVIIRHAEADFPNECCGFLYGKIDGERLISLAVPARNAQEGDQRKRFLIDPLDYMKAEDYAWENGLDFIGIYHSHPNHPAEPSIHDLRQAMPEFSYLIVSVWDGKLDHARSWTLNDGGAFDEEQLSFS